MPTKDFATNILALQGLKVLVVDNNVDCCDLIELLLGFYGVEVKKAFLAQQALQIFVEWQPNILITEIALPEVDGFTLVRQVKAIAIERDKELLVIAVTAYINDQIRQLAISNGFSCCFTKPLNLDDFVAVLRYRASCQFPSVTTQSLLNNCVNNNYKYLNFSGIN